jgi:hypothetical protein
LRDDKAVIDVRDNLFRILTFVLEADGPEKGRVVLDRVCMSIAMIALKSSNSCWMKSVDDIIAFGSTNQQQCYLSMVLLKNICQLFEDEISSR